MKLEEYMYRSQLPRMRYIIENYENSAAIRKKLPDAFHKVCVAFVWESCGLYESIQDFCFTL